MNDQDQPQQQEANFEPNPYQAYLPGYPKRAVEGLFAKPEISERIFAQAGTAAYNWNQVEDITTDKPTPNTQWKAIDPAALYVNCMPWTAYPFGIPVSDQPCPYYKPPKREVATQSWTESSSVSSPTQTFSESASSENVLRPSTKHSMERRAREMEEAIMYGWTGK